MNKEILKQALEKVMENGFRPLFFYDSGGGYMSEEPLEGDDLLDACKDSVESEHAYAICFNHDFAKAFWGEKITCFACGSFPTCWCDTSDVYPREGTLLFNWQFHLQQMVLEEDPIKYLEQFL